MDAEQERAAEQRGYSRGYQAGRKRQEADHERDMRRAREQARFDAFYCAALSALIQCNGWTTGGKAWKSMEDFVDGAKDFARLSLRRIP